MSPILVTYTVPISAILRAIMTDVSRYVAILPDECKQRILNQVIISSF
jgi:hypothetical protein